jgi:hypothetical protein
MAVRVERSTQTRRNLDAAQQSSERRLPRIAKITAPAVREHEAPARSELPDPWLQIVPIPLVKPARPDQISAAPAAFKQVG